MSFLRQPSSICEKCQELFRGHWADENDFASLLQIKLVTDADGEKDETESDKVPENPATDELQETSAWRRRHHTISDMQNSAKDGCHLCTILWDMIGQKMEEMDASEELKERLLSAKGYPKIELWKSLDSESDDSDAASEATEEDYDLCLVLSYFLDGDFKLHSEVLKASLSLLMLKPGGRVDTSPAPAGHSTLSSARTLQYISTWLKDCSKNHIVCQERATLMEVNPGAQTLPTRLLQVGSSLNDGKLSLCESRDLSPDTRYMTLSHCWGRNLRMRLLKSSYNQFTRDIPFMNLPRSFQDAISLTRALGVRYLWIDALCIIQDAEDDWLRESMLMSSVYSFSWLNIAATSSTDGNGGLFHSRNLLLATPCIVDTQWTGYESGRYLCYDDSAWERRISQSPLNKRAWVLQERLLAPRTLHCATDQLWWECAHFRACEAFVKELPPPRYKKPFHLGWFPEDSAKPVDIATAWLRLDQSDVAGLNENWLAIMKHYSKCGLTNGSDKLVALAGLAKAVHFRTSIPESAYIAGFWTIKLELDLLWHVVGRGQRQDAYRAPTWSWASVNGEIHFRGFKDGSGALEAREIVVNDVVEIQTSSVTDPMGPVEDGYVTLKGPLRRARLSGIYDSGHDLSFRELKIGDVIDRGFQDRLDDASLYDNWPVVGKEVYCAFFVASETSKDHGYLEGLILERAGSGGRGEYHRMGWLKSHHGSPFKMLREITDKEKLAEDEYLEHNGEENYTFKIL